MPAPLEPTLTAAFCRVLTDHLQAQGHALPVVLDALGVSEAQLADAECRVPRRRFNAALEVAITLTADPFLGLHLGEQIRPAHYGVLGYVMMSCDTSRQLVERHRLWHQLVAGGARVEYAESPGRLSLRELLPAGEGLVTRAGCECQMSAMLSFARWVFGRQFRPLEVSFPFAAPSQLGEYQRIFQCALHFGADRFGLVIHNGLLDQPLPQADPELRRLMEAKAQRQAAELGLEEDAFLGKLRQCLARLLPQQVPEVETVAAALNISVSTLQRRLRERGSHYKAVLDALRRDLAQAYLRDPQLSLTDIALLLGFSQQSAFNRAYRRWFDCSPGQMRSELSR